MINRILHKILTTIHSQSKSTKALMRYTQMHRSYYKFMHRVIIFSRSEKIKVKNSASHCVNLR